MTGNKVVGRGHLCVCCCCPLLVTVSTDGIYSGSVFLTIRRIIRSLLLIIGWSTNLFLLVKYDFKSQEIINKPIFIHFVSIVKMIISLISFFFFT